MSDPVEHHLLICDGPSCGVVHESDLLADEARAITAANGELTGRVRLWRFTCFDRCDDGPNMMVCPAKGRFASPRPTTREAQWPGAQLPTRADGAAIYTGMDSSRLLRVLNEHCAQATPVAEWAEEP